MQPKHIIDILIEERAPKLVNSGFWWLFRPILNFLLGYSKAFKMANDIEKLSGHDAISYVSKLLSLDCKLEGFENLKIDGPLIIIANHPTGIADGIALYDSLIKYRKDIKFYANSDALRICEKFSDVIIPIEWVYEKRTREKTKLTLTQTKQTIDNNMALAIFPAGRLARKINGKLIDPEWANSAVSIAKKYNVPILPIKIKGPEAHWFHFFDKFSQELRDITLFHELLNKKGKTYFLKAAPIIMPFEIDDDVKIATQKLKDFIEFDM